MSKKLDLSNFEKKLEVRNIQKDDLDQILEMQKVCFPNMEPWKRVQLESHLRIFPEGQFCVEFDGKIIGSCSSLIVNFDEYDDKHTWDDITDGGYITNHNPEGFNLYGIEVMVDPEYQGMKIGKRLYE
ncbi:GNAT family N-acetyltransferase, partial [Enterococcus faecium]|uniref:GNAT family N-acetyltransferase n=2 Tax=Bacilli TaxID=91061 RepID=UPI0030C85642